VAKYILGIQGWANHDSGACMIKYSEKKSEIIAISEERLIRKKYSYHFPLLSILYCMNHFKIKSFKKIDLIVSDWARTNRWLRNGPGYNYQMFDYIKEKLDIDKKKVKTITHHLGHAASAYYASNFKDSAVLVVDGNGSDVETTSFYSAKNKNINLIQNYKNQGIGAAYTAVTLNILNLGTGSEGKTMGLAPYGKRNKKIKIPYKLDGIKNDFENFMLRMPYSDVLNQKNDNYRLNPVKAKIALADHKNVTNKYYRDWAFKIQDVCEEVMIHLTKSINKKTNHKNICVVGGVALNCVANEKLFQNSKFKDMFVFPASSDAGLPYGLALWGYYKIKKQTRKIKFNNAYTGIEYSNKDILGLLKKNRIKFKKTSEFEIADLISKDFIIGHLSGASEYGPRALGNRSILANAQNPKMRDYINNAVKHRETYRPFAPAILEKESKKYFDLDYSPFMLRVSKCKRKNEIPSACHIDGTARVQTVNKKQNERFYKILQNYKKITGVPVVMNTSFNDKGEPLVETPLDALLCFLKTKIDYLVLNDYLIDRNQIKNKNYLISKLEKERNLEIKRNQDKAIRLLTKGFNEKEFNRRKALENKKAIYHTLNRPLNKFKDFFKEIKKDERILIIGANDHTNVLIRYLNIKKNENIFFKDINKNDVYTYNKKLKYLKSFKNKELKTFDKILVSSFQRQEDILDKYKKYKKKISFFYDNSSRSIIDYFYIKKYKGKFPLYEKSL
jgi:carbamoyltransferase